MDAVDAAWWRMDSATNRMTIVAILRFDAAFGADEFRDLLKARLEHFPQFQRRAVVARGRPHWEMDPGFDYDNHVVRVTEDIPADSESLKAFVGTRMSASLPPDRPPWQFSVIENFEGGSVVVARLHHAIADGLALIRVLEALADDAEPIPSDGSFSAAPSKKGIGGWLHNLWGTAAAVSKFAFTGSDTRSSLQGTLGVDKRVDWSRPLEIRALRKAAISHSSTINDVLMAAFAGGLRRYLGRHREMSEGFELRALVPVNLRHRHDSFRMGNRFGLVILSLPVGLLSLGERIREIHLRMRRLRLSMEPASSYGLLSALGRVPQFLENAAVRKLSATSSAAITNVPGPRQPLVLAGRTLKELMFWVPRGGSVGMGISILTYAGQARLGFATDAGLVSDPRVLAGFFEEEVGLVM
jgi:diacylglycerol O-acyltransferase / wax synthase